ncbi:PREDICTED: disease resistance protein LAZ5-like [Camelina sativa]|uniref:Disease resistance protein LAZ5-like n=1 Tax=Camelina sativa TaxID=90675 RepID=A0ABM0WB97_CAMSA|nr:PREDICTED: disease resistance protein LAZ5-like [Camelina sativa]
MESPPAKFDVFLSFRGSDTRKNFTGHLHDKLSGKGIDSFIDDKLCRGDDIAALFDRIEQSKIAIIVFSKNFTNSTWCLRELVKILQCRDINKQVVIPIFYNIEKPDLMRMLVGNERFTDDEISSWKAALTTAFNISGYVINDTSTSEADLLNEIAFDTLKKLSDLAPVGNHALVGIESRVEALEKLLSCHELGSVRVIGIVGMAGIGKSALADCLYGRLRGQFDGSCFLSKISENLGRSGLEYLLEKLLSTLLNERNLEIGAPETAHAKFESRLKSKKLLIVLDDVNHEKQVRDLMGHRKWYRGGSRIIITTRDCKLVETIQGRKYVLPRLNDREALKLFSSNAFGDSTGPLKEFQGLTNMVLDYAKGHPLALKVLGSDLCKMDKQFWEARLEILKSKSHGDIYEVLETSFDELSKEQKDIFLDIACFFRSEKVDYVTSLLYSRGTNVSSVIQELVDKCLITVVDNRIEMHEMLQTMGKEISTKPEPIGIRDYRWISQHRPQRDWHLRLWDSEDICDQLTKDMGSKNIRGIFLDTSNLGAMRLRSKAFNGMYNLKYIKIYDSRCSRRCEVDHKLYSRNGFDFLPDELTYLHWHGCPLQSLPENFYPKYLVDLKLPYSKLVEIWGDDKDARMLKWVDLSHSLELRRCLGLANAQNLERLNLEGCKSLEKLPSSMNCLEKLIYLNLRECTSLRSLPKEIKNQSLQTLILSGCSSLKKCPQISENVEVLLLDGTAIKTLPESIETLGKLVLLNLRNCKKLKRLSSGLYKLNCLRELILSGCSQLEVFPEIKENMEALEILLLDDTAITELPKMMHLSNIKTFSLCGTSSQVFVSMFFMLPTLCCSRLTDLYLSRCNLYKLPDNIGGLSSLQSLCLSGNNIENLPESFDQLQNLKWFDLKYCKFLKSIPALPQNLQYLDAHECESLETLANPLTPLNVGERIQSMFMFSNCYKLNKEAHESLVSHARIKSQLMANASVKRYYRGFIPESVAMDPENNQTSPLPVEGEIDPNIPENYFGAPSCPSD